MRTKAFDRLDKWRVGCQQKKQASPTLSSWNQIVRELESTYRSPDSDGLIGSGVVESALIGFKGTAIGGSVWPFLTVPDDVKEEGDGHEKFSDGFLVGSYECHVFGRFRKFWRRGYV